MSALELNQLQSATDSGVIVYRREDGVFVGSDGDVEPILHADRGRTFSDLPEGPTRVPISRWALKLWQEVINLSSSCTCESWGVQRATDLCSLAKVSEFLRDDRTLERAISRLATLLTSSSQHTATSTGGPPWWTCSPPPEPELERDSSVSAADAQVLCKALSDLHHDLQVAVLIKARLRPATLLPLLPDDLLSAFAWSHYQACSLDFSGEAKGSSTFLSQFSASLGPRVQALVPHVSCLRPLRHFRIENDPFGDVTEHITEAVLSSHASDLRTLSMQGSSVSDNAWRTREVKLWTHLRECSSLTHLDMSRCMFDTRRAERLSAALQSMTLLQDLNLSRNFLNDTAMHALCPALSTLACLTHLDLSNNCMKNSVRALAGALEGMCALRQLHIGSNRPSCWSLACLLGAAAGLAGLTTLCLDRMEVSVKGVAAEVLDLVKAGAEAYLAVIADPALVFKSADSSERSIREPPVPVLPPAHAVREPGDCQLAESGCYSPADGHDALNDAEGGDSEAVSDSGASIQQPQQGTALSEADADTIGAYKEVPLRRLSLRHFKAPEAAQKVLFQALMGDGFSWAGPGIDPVPQLHDDNAAGDDLHAAGAVPAVAPVPAPQASLPSWRLVDWLRHVEVLDVSGTSLQETIASEIARAVCSLPALKELRMASCGLSEHSSYVLCAYIADHGHHLPLLGCRAPLSGARGLTSFDLSGNDVSAEALCAICRIGTLQELRLRDCGVCDSRAEVLGTHVGQLQDLTRLDLGRNWLGGEGVGEVVIGCRQLVHLQVLGCGYRVGVDAAAVHAAVREGVKVVFSSL